MPYAAFTEEDFCKDPHFIRWVVTPTDELNRFWRAFMADYPHKVADIQLAADYVKSIHFHEIEPSAQDLSRLKLRIWASIDQESRTDPVRVVQWYRRPYWKAAAVVLLASSGGLGWWAYQASSQQTYETAYGTLQEITLDDGSRVTLNAHSSLRVATKLADSPVREVWLDGEAYFSIARRNGARFIVHTPNANVDVLGTTFTVNTRRAQTRVVLQEGKVQLTATNQPALLMKPGDMATVKPQSPRIELKKVQPDQYDAWKESFIVLDGKSLTEIISTLEDTFGVTIKLEDSQLLEKKLTGKLQTKVAQDCIDNLAVILEADVRKTGDTYLFR